MFGGRTRYGLPIILYQWIAGSLGIIFVLTVSLQSDFAFHPIHFVVLALFLILHIIASFLQFQYTRMNVPFTFRSSFTTAALFALGNLPAVWIASIGIVVLSAKRIIRKRYLLKKPDPLAYDLSLIIFNAGITGTIWYAASWIYIHYLHSDLPLMHLTLRNVLCITIMFLALVTMHHIVLFISRYLRGQKPAEFVKRDLVPGFFSEFAAIPFGAVLALSYNRMGTLAFVFLSFTLLWSNAVLRRLSLIRYDLEEKLRQLTSLNRVSKKIISVQEENEVMNLLFEELSSVAETDSWFLARVDEWKTLHILKENSPVCESLMELAGEVVRSKQPLLISNTSKEGPATIREALLSDGIRSCIVVPLLVGQKTHGVLAVFSTEVAAFKHEHMQVLIMVADEAALALENSKLYHALTDKVAELEHVNTELRQLDRLKSQFLANVSHELRTPLTSIKGYVEYIIKEKLGPVTPMQSDGLRVAQRNILRLQRLINDLLDYTKLEFNKTPIQIRPCRFEDLWKEVYEQFSEVIERRNFALHLRIPPDLPTLLVDGPRFTVVLINLLSNAIKFSDEQGTITIRAQSIHHPGPFFRSEAYDPNCSTQALVPVEILISDEGIGIPPEAMPRIFDRFYQVDSSNTRKYGGTGLGLALVKSILDAHGIPIDVQSKVGYGTSFGMVVPSLRSTDLAPSLKTDSIESEPSTKYLT